MKTTDEQTTISPTEARGAEKSGIVWKILAASMALAVIGMVAIGQGATVPAA